MLKIIKWEDIENYKKLWHDKKSVLVGGCFDILHFGHLKFLQQAKKSGDLLIVALESDQFIKKKKGKPPFHNQKERGEILSALTVVDFIIMLSSLMRDDDYFQLVKKVSPKIIAVTTGDTQMKSKKDQAEKVGAKLLTVIPLIKRFSSSKILDYESVFSG